MGQQYFESPLLLALKRILVGIELPEDMIITCIVIRYMHTLPYNPDAIVPTSILCGVIDWRFCGHLNDFSRLCELLQKRIVVLLEQADEFICITPFSLVVILN